MGARAVQINNQSWFGITGNYAGALLSGGRADFYNVQTDSLQAVFTASDKSGSTVNTVTLNAAGMFSSEVYYDGTLKVLVYDADGVLQHTAVDNTYYVDSFPSSTFVNATDYEDGSFDASTINAALTDIGSNVKVLLLKPGTWTIDANVTVPKNVTLWPVDGAVLSISTGITLTINGPLQANVRKIFTINGTGTVAFGKGYVEHVYPQWWGAVADGSTDCSSEIYYAITQSNNLPVKFVQGDYNVTTKKDISTLASMRIEGDRRQDYLAEEGARILFNPATASDTYIWKITSLEQLHISNIAFVNQDTSQQNDGLQLNVLADSNRIDLKIENTNFQGFTGTAVKFGGECYGDVVRCSFRDNSQCYAVNGGGELRFLHNYMEKINSYGSFSAGTNNADAWVYVYGTIVHHDMCWGAIDTDARDLFLFENTGTTFFKGNKFERPGLTTMSNNMVSIKHSGTQALTVFRDNYFTASSLSNAAHAGRFLMLEGTGIIRNTIIDSNVLTYGPSVPSTVPCIDMSDGSITLSGGYIGPNYWENGSTPFLKMANASSAYAVMENWSFAHGDLIQLTSDSISFSAAQTGGTINFYTTSGTTDFLRLKLQGQLIPVSIWVQLNNVAGDDLSVYWQYDSSKAQKITLGSAVQELTMNYDLISDFCRTVTLSADVSPVLTYDSGASLTGSLTGRIGVTFMVLKWPGASAGSKIISV